MKIAVVPFHTIAKDVARKIPEIYREMKMDYERPDVDWDYYLEASHAGTAFAVIAHDKEMAGLSIFIVERNAHHDFYEADNTLFYITPKHRGRLAKDMVRRSAEFFAKRGIKKVNYSTKDERIGRLLAQCGFGIEYKTYSITTG